MLQDMGFLVKYCVIFADFVAHSSKMQQRLFSLFMRYEFVDFEHAFAFLLSPETVTMGSHLSSDN
jgi:hypothetical protein